VYVVSKNERVVLKIGLDWQSANFKDNPPRKEIKGKRALGL
jgi:hypothetical protein